MLVVKGRTSEKESQRTLKFLLKKNQGKLKHNLTRLPQSFNAHLKIGPNTLT